MNKLIKNVFFGFGAQLLILAVGFVMRRVVLVAFGSEVNGITATITQIITYITLMEAGVGNATRNCLHKNIAQGDRLEICSTISATKKYFRRITPLYAACVLLFAALFPLMMETEVPARTVRLVIILQGLSFVVDFLFANSYLQLLYADGRGYIPSGLALLERSVAAGLQVLLIWMGYDIVSVQLAYFLGFAVKAIIVNIYIRRSYPWLKKDPAAAVSKLPQRGAFAVHELTRVVFNSTDVVLVAVFCSVKEASVYSIYSMVFVALYSVFEALFKAIEFNLGAQYHRDREAYKKMHDAYESMLLCFVFAVVAAACIVILPFVRLYTDGVTDVDYMRPALPVLFALVQVLSVGKLIPQKLVDSAGKTQATVPNTLAEAAINIVASVVFVNLFGMAGVLLGKIVALLYRTNDVVLYANRKVLRRFPWHTYKMYLLNLLVFAAVMAVSFAIPLEIGGYLQFLLSGAAALTGTMVVYFGLNCALDQGMRSVVAELFEKFLHKTGM